MVRLSVLVSILILLMASLLVVPAAPAQAGADRARDEDPRGDVSAYGPDGPVEEAPLPTPLAPPIDLVAAWIGDETPTRLSFGIEVADMTRPQGPFLQGVTYVLCFEREGSPHRYALVALLSYGNALGANANEQPSLAKLDIKRLHAKAGDPADVKGCDTLGTQVVDQVLTQYVMEVRFLPDDARLEVDVPRDLLAALGGAAEGEGSDPLPAAGETFRIVKASASHRQGPAVVHYDETPGGKEFTLRSDTGNRGLVVSVPDTTGLLFPGRESLAVPVYGVEIGGLQAVPFTILNLLGEDVEADISVEVVAGDAEKWRMHHLDRIRLPAGNETAPGNETLTLVVSGDPTLAHKERVRLLIKATTASSEDALGVGIVDVMGVVPPTKENPKLYFHNSGATCNTNAFWFNTLKADGAAATTPFIACPYQGESEDSLAGLATVGEIARVFKPDVPFQRDYVLDTSAPVDAEIALRAIHRAARAAEVPFPVKADVIVQVLADRSVIGEGRLLDAEVPGEGEVFQVPVHYYGELLRPDRRPVSDDTRLEVRVTVVSDTRTWEVGGYCVDEEEEVCLPQEQVDVGPPPARIEMILGSSALPLPILESRSASPYMDLRESGALLSLRASGEPKSVYMNAGKTAVRTLELRNEGLNPDTARLGATITVTRTISGEEEVLPHAAGWRIAFAPQDELPLDRGERVMVEVTVLAPEDAVEGDRLSVDVTATSTVDELMVTRVPYTFLVTNQEEIESETGSIGPAPKQKDTPAPPVAVLLGVLAALAVAARRRRTS